MDPASALLLLHPTPQHIDQQSTWLRGAFLPVILPTDGLPTQDRITWLLADNSAPAYLRVEAALAAERSDEAFRLVITLGQPVTGSLALSLSTWAAQELERLRLPAALGPVLILEPGSAGPLRKEAAQVLAEVSNLLPLPWPRWAGPLVVVGPDAEINPIPGRTRLLRPAAPVLKVADADRGRLAIAIAQLALDLTAPPRQGWPAWLRQGLGELARQRTLNLGPSPRRMREARLQAGAGAISRVFTADAVEAPLAAALCLPLIHHAYRQRFAVLLDLLRNDIAAEKALRLAYGWSIDELVTAR